MSEPLKFELQATDAGIIATFNKVESGIKDVTMAFNKLSDLTGEVSTGLKHVDATATATDKALADVAGSSKNAAGGLAQVDAAATRTGKAVNTVADSSKRAADHGTFLTGSLDKVKAGFVAVGTALAAFGVGMAAMTQQVTSNAVEVDRWSQRLGVSVDWMSRMQFAAAPLGLDMNSLGEALSNATEKLSEAAVGGNDSARMLAQLGIAATDSAGNVREIDAVLPELATALQGMTNDADRVTVGLRLFGEEGSRMIPMLLQGAEGLAAFQARADLFGTTMSDTLVSDSKEFQSGLQGVMGALQGTANAIVGAVLPAFNAILPQVTAFVIQLKDSSIVQATLIPLLQGVAEGVGGLANNLPLVEKAWNTINATFNEVVAGTLRGIGTILEGLKRLLDGASKAAEFLRMPGVAESLRQASQGVQDVKADVLAMGKIATETADEWRTKTIATADSFGMIAARLKDAQAQTKLLDEQTKKNKGTIDELVLAYQRLGLETAQALKDAADKGVEAFRKVVEDQKANTQIIAAAWENLQQKLIEAYGRIPPRFKVIDEAIKSGNRALIEANLEQWLTWIKAAEEAYDNVPDNLRPANQRIIQGAQETGVGVVGAFQAAGTAIVTDINGRWIPAVDGFVTDVNGRLMPALGAGMVDAFGHITRAGQTAWDALHKGGTQAMQGIGESAEAMATQIETRFLGLTNMMEARFGQFEGFETPFGTTETEIAEQIRGFEAAITGLRGPGQHHTIPGYVEFQIAEYNKAISLLYQKLAELKKQQDERLETVQRAAGQTGMSGTAGTGGTSGTQGTGGTGSQFGGSGLVSGIDHTNYEAIRAAIAAGRAQMLGYVTATGEALYDFGDGLGRTIRQFLLTGLQDVASSLGTSLGGTTITYGPPPAGSGTPAALGSGGYLGGGTPGGPIDYGYGLPGMASGGLVPGYGPPDSLVTRVSPGERIFSPGDNKEIMQLLREALSSRREGRHGAAAGRTVAPPTINVQIAYTGVQNPRQMVRDLRDALQEEVRRGGLTLAAR